ncbi:MAG TPA: hypothetical protein VKV02_07860 [Acidobacteriaceae bacterium]|nr:hypothetical protein [Acidobacteriaceae bacterium]
MTKSSPKIGALKVPGGPKATTLGEKAAKAIKIRESAAKARSGKSVTFPTQLRRDR